MTVGGDVQRLVAAVENFHDVRGRGAVDDGRGDELVHGLVI